MNIKSVTLVLIVLMISGCETVKSIPVKLPLPPEIPQEERLTQEELECISNVTLHKIILLDKRRLTLRSIIESTHN